jgi:hypothetical protein
MRHADRYQDGLTGGRPAGQDGWAAGPQTGGQRLPSAPPAGADGGWRQGLGALWLLLAPTLVGLLGLPAATRLQATGTITYFFATKQDWLLGGALTLLAASGLWSVRKLACAACLASDCCELPATPATSAAGDHGHGDGR